MATTTPNYAWVVPTSSDLVKNGATAIETLGDSVDASLWNSGYGQAGKNKLINGDFSINQRAFTSVTTNTTYTFDRFWTGASGTDGTSTFTPQVFTPGTAPVAGYEAKNYLRVVTAGQTTTDVATTINQFIEGVRTFANQTMTVSFWAKANTGTPSLGMLVRQGFGTGGSPSANVDTFGSVIPITTSWARYSKTFTVPSISGKTIGTANDSLRIGLIFSAGSAAFSGLSGVTIQNNTFEVWGFQAEYGSYATPFQTATGTLQGELAACQRYYYRFVPFAGSGGNYYGGWAVGGATSTTNAFLTGHLPVALRSAPTISRSGGQIYNLISNIAASGLGNAWATGTSFSINVTVASGLVLNQVCQYAPNNSASDYLDFSSEL
jgi:hypothetical protein